MSIIITITILILAHCCRTGGAIVVVVHLLLVVVPEEGALVVCDEALELGDLGAQDVILAHATVVVAVVLQDSRCRRQRIHIPRPQLLHVGQLRPHRVQGLAHAPGTLHLWHTTHNPLDNPGRVVLHGLGVPLHVAAKGGASTCAFRRNVRMTQSA